MSFLKYADNPDIVRGNGRGPLSFHRSHLDGMPYRGPRAMLRDEEYEQFTDTVQDGFVFLFDLADPNHAAKINQIVDAAANQWYSIFRMQEYAVPQPDGSLKLFVYCVWSEPHKELAKHRVPTGLIQA